MVFNFSFDFMSPKSLMQFQNFCRRNHITDLVLLKVKMSNIKATCSGVISCQKHVGYSKSFLHKLLGKVFTDYCIGHLLERPCCIIKMKNCYLSETLIAEEMNRTEGPLPLK